MAFKVSSVSLRFFVMAAFEWKPKISGSGN
jgi:hypothetical protein